MNYTKLKNIFDNLQYLCEHLEHYENEITKKNINENEKRTIFNHYLDNERNLNNTFH